jgi:tetratricopeptide (TPR) repeat protein
VLAWHLGWKHWHLAQAERSLERAPPAAAAEAAQAALAHDADSVLARVALAQAARQEGETGAAEAHLREAIEHLPAHPLPHLLLGDVLRQQGDSAAALPHLAYEQNSLQDLQAWAWQWFETPPPAMLDVGSGHDLGHVRGFHFAQTADGTDWRWTTDTAYLRLAVPAPPEPDAAQCCPQPDAAALLVLRLAASRPPAVPLPELRIAVNGQPVETLRVENAWQEYTLPLPAAALGEESAPLVVALRSDTFRPRTYNRASDDGRVLGVMVESVRIVPCSTLSPHGMIVY